MTVATQTSEAILTGNGSTTVFPFTFPTLEASNIVVDLISPTGLITPQAQGTNYTVQNAGFEQGGTITMNVAPANGTRVRIRRILPYTQPTDYKNQGSFYPATHERSFDRATMQIQQLATGVGGAMQLIPGPDGGFVWDARGARIINVGSGIAQSDAANVGQAGTGGGGGGGGGLPPGAVVIPKFWEFVGNGTETDFFIPGADVADALYYDVAVGGVAQNPDDDYDIIVGSSVQNSIIRFSTPPPNGVVGWAILRAFLGPATSQVSPQLPVFVIPGTTATLDAGFRQGHILCTAATTVTLALRANNGNTALDWKSGDYFSVVQKGTGQVTVSPASGVTIEIPTGFFARTRARYSVISFVCDDPSTNTWTIGNDMATS